MTACAIETLTAFQAGASAAIAMGLASLVAWRVTRWVESWRARRGGEEIDAMEDMDLFTAADAIEARDRALEKAADNAWVQLAMPFFERLPQGFTGIGYAFRKAMTDAGCPKPPRSMNTWGAFIRVLGQKGLIVKTGAWDKMDYEGSNAHPSPVWTKVAREEVAA